jgi:cytochrome c oxidase subunit I
MNAAEAARVLEPAEAPSYLSEDRGVRSWLLTFDHKRIGVMYLVAIGAALFLGGVFALVLRLNLWRPEGGLVSNDAYNKLFTLHGAVMIFLFVIPGIPAALGNFVVPLQLGAKDLAFPRVNLLSFWLYVTGAVLFVATLVVGGLDTGWTLYPPYSLESARGLGILIALAAVFLAGFSSILTGLNFIATIHRMRPPGMGWFDLPLFLWALYATGIIQIIATPVLGITAAMGFLERLFHLGLFMPEYGGDPVLFQHFFWFYSHPAVYIMILPAMAVISEVVCAFSRKNMFGYKAVAYSSLGIAFVGFFTWGHHLFTSGQSTMTGGIFGVLSMFVGIFTAIKVFNWTATLYKGAVQFTTSFAYFCGFLFFLVFGGMTGIALATVALDIHWQDTYFVVAHFHFIMVGAVIMAWLAGLHYWWPKMFGRMYSEGWGLVSAVLIILGFNATFIPQFLLGNYGMPRRYYSYPDRFWPLNVASTAGASLLAFGFLIIFIYLMISLRYGKISGPNPWHSRGFEWDTLSPPPVENFLHDPVYTHGPHDYTELPPGAEVKHAT